MDSCGWCLMHPVFFISLSLLFIYFLYHHFFFYKDLDFELDGYFSHSIPFKFFRLENFVVIWLIRVRLWLRPRGWVLEKKKTHKSKRYRGSCISKKKDDRCPFQRWNLFLSHTNMLHQIIINNDKNVQDMGTHG